MEVDYEAVARRSGLSVRTVSDHLSGRDQVSPPTRAKINRAMAQLYGADPVSAIEHAAESLASTAIQALQVAREATLAGSESRRFVEDALKAVKAEWGLMQAAMKVQATQLEGAA